MNFADPLAFITTQMRMSHIYQPLLIRALADAGGTDIIGRLGYVVCQR